MSNLMIILLFYSIPLSIALLGSWILCWKDLHYIGDFLFPDSKDKIGAGWTAWVSIYNILMAFVILLYLIVKILDIRVK